MRSRWSRSAQSCSGTGRGVWHWAVWPTGHGASRPPRPSCRAARKPSPGSCSPAPSRRTTTHSSCRSSSARSALCWRKRRTRPMKFDTPATDNAIDQLKVIGKPTDRIDGKLKTTGTARYAYERHDVAPNQAYGFVIGSAIAKGRIASIDVSRAKAAPGVLAVVTAESAGKLGKGDLNTAKLLGGPEIEHYHQA